MLQLSCELFIFSELGISVQIIFIQVLLRLNLNFALLVYRIELGQDFCPIFLMSISIVLSVRHSKDISSLNRLVIINSAKLSVDVSNWRSYYFDIRMIASNFLTLLCWFYISEDDFEIKIPCLSLSVAILLADPV